MSTTKQNTESRILLFEDERLAQQLQQDFKYFEPVLTRLKKTYEGLELGSFTEKVMESLTIKGIAPTEKAYKESIKMQIDRAGITNSVIREDMEAKAQPALQHFQVGFSQARNFTPAVYNMNRPTLTFSFISYNDKLREFEVKKKQLEQLRELHCRVYLENENEKNLYAAIAGFRAAYNSILEVSETIGIQYEGQHHGTPQLKGIMSAFFTWNGTDLEIRPKSIKDAIQWTETAKRLQDERTKRAGTLGATGMDNAGINDGMSEIFKSLKI